MTIAQRYFHALPLLNAVSIVVSGALFAAAIYFIVKTGWLRARIQEIDDVIFKSDLARKKVGKSWSEIERSFFSGSDEELKLAVLKADVLLAEALKESGLQGKDLGERLKRVKTSVLPNLDNVWEAHKLRNRLAHDPDFVLKRDAAERALTVYEEALQHLGALAKDSVEGSAKGS